MSSSPPRYSSSGKSYRLRPNTRSDLPLLHKPLLNMSYTTLVALRNRYRALFLLTLRTEPSSGIISSSRLYTSSKSLHINISITF